MYRYGYVEDRQGLDTNELDEDTSKALIDYQTCQGLPATGDFDQNTRHQMASPRCAFPDRQSGVAFVTLCDWGRNEITFSFDTGTTDISGSGDFQANRNAFQTWSAVIPVDFREVPINQNPDVLIGWRPSSDPDLSMVGGTLAHADFPPGCGVVTNSLPKPIHFDDSEHNWVIGASPGSFDIETVALHEIGHIIGLAHSNVTGSVMFPSISSNTTNRALTQDDISGAQNLYGRRTVSTPSNGWWWG